MNDQLQKFARDELKQGLAECTEAEVVMFKRMYSHKNLELPINDVIENMDEGDLDLAMRQVQRTLEKKGS